MLADHNMLGALHGRCARCVANVLGVQCASVCGDTSVLAELDSEQRARPCREGQIALASVRRVASFHTCLRSPMSPPKPLTHARRSPVLRSAARVVTVRPPMGMKNSADL